MCVCVWAERGGGGSGEIILLTEMGILGGEEGLREDNLDILQFKGKLRDQ